MRLLPEWRKASKLYQERNHVNNRVKFGTVDWAVHKDLCQKVLHIPVYLCISSELVSSKVNLQCYLPILDALINCQYELIPVC